MITNSTKLNGLSIATVKKSLHVGKKSSVSGTIAKVNLTFDDYQLLVPVLLPNLEEVRLFAKQLHASGKAWEGEAFGWNAGYSPGKAEPPPDSKMTFTPADFWLGDGALWFFALLWERGNDQPPIETLYDKNVVGTLE